MKNKSFSIITLTLLLFAGTCQTTTAQIAILADTVYTMESDPIVNGIVLIKGDKIEEVGAATDIDIPANYERHEASVVTPGLIDAHSVVGLAGIYNQEHDQDQLEKSNAIQPELRAIDAYNPREDLVEFVRSLGVTTIHTGHGPGALVSGQTLIAKTSGTTVAESVIDSTFAMAMTLGPGVSQNYQKPGTRSKGMAMLRQEFIKARDYAEKKSAGDESKHPARDLSMEMLANVLSGEIPAMITAQKTTEIDAALRLADEFGFRLILDGAAEAYLMLDEIKKSGVDVLIHPTMVRNFGGTKNATMETAAKLKDNSIRFAFQSGYEGYVPKTRIVLFEAAMAAANGLPRQDALRAITKDAAEILDVENRVGSLEAGKDADLVMFDGDPLEYTTHVTGVFINGKLVSDEKR